MLEAKKATASARKDYPTAVCLAMRAGGYA